MKNVFDSSVSIIVGITAVVLLDKQLGGFTSVQFTRILHNDYAKLALLFGAAYAANGAKVIPALFAMYIYFAFKTIIKPALFDGLLQSNQEEEEADDAWNDSTVD